MRRQVSAAQHKKNLPRDKKVALHGLYMFALGKSQLVSSKVRARDVLVKR